jgi:Ca-activated chloride channel family protein
MDLLWPEFLLLMGIIPLLIVAYIWMQRRKRRFAVRYSSLALVRDALPRRSSWRRHLPFALFLLALASLVMAFARPATIITLPTNQTSIILTIDVSGSMRSTDIAPTRLQAAEQAALSFVLHQKATTQFGLVAFSNFAEIVQPPTTDQEAMQSAIESLTVGRRTAIGSAILTSIDAISQIDPNVPASMFDATSGDTAVPVPKGDYAPDIIVLLTDGVSNTGPSPLDTAQEAVTRGIRIYTIGFGTPNGMVDPGGPSQIGPGNGGGGGFGRGGGFGGFGGGGGGFRTGIDETTLKQIADMTGGKYYAAGSASELEAVFNSLPTSLIAKHAVQEISVIFTAAGALMALAAIAFSLVWHPLP